jgi:hypothetical protein
MEFHTVKRFARRRTEEFLESAARLAKRLAFLARLSRFDSRRDLVAAELR